MRGDRKASLSARRAWIEINKAVKQLAKDNVALRKESVDRNAGGLFGRDSLLQSLSARRAWIEIFLVATPAVLVTSRSPQGERG